MGEFRMPSLGAGMDAGKLLEWYVHPGDQVHRGDVVALVETDKAAIEVEIFEDGVVDSLVIEEGTKVPVGTVLAHLGEPGTASPAPAEEAVAREASGEPVAAGETSGEASPEDEAPAEAPRREVAATPSAATAEPGGGPTPRVRPGHRPVVVSPLVRHLAADRHVDLGQVAGTGPGGTVTRADVEHAAVAGSRVRASPLARRLAHERGIALVDLAGSGPRGAIVARDVPDDGSAPPTPPETPAAEPDVVPSPPAPAASAQPAAPPATSDADDRSLAMRQAIARAMTQSKREIPHYYLGQHVDVEPALAWLEDRNADRPPRERILPAVLILKATALACHDHPGMNGFWIDDALQPATAIHLGVAISLRGGGLVAPAIHHTDQRSLDDLMAALTDLVKRARTGRMRGSEMTDPTITVTNLGDRGVESVYGVIYPPQVALVGVGRIEPRPWVVDGLVGVRRAIHVTLSADHRAGDGHTGALFLDAIARRLKEPEML